MIFQSCDQEGIECSKSLIETFATNCITPCQGVYASIWKEELEIVTENSEGMKWIFDAYNEYKNMFSKNILYPVGTAGMTQG